MEKEQVIRQFDRVSTHYEQNATVQTTMATFLITQLLTHLKGPSPSSHHIRSILEVGCGTGILTRHLVRVFPKAHIVAIDFSQTMLLSARACPTLAHVEFLHADAEAITFPPNTWDLVVSNAVLQWFFQPKKTITSWYDSLRPGGTALATTFGPQTFCELKKAAHRAGIEGWYQFPLHSLNQWRDLWGKAGYGDIFGSEILLRHTYQNAIDLLHTIQGMGGTRRPIGKGIRHRSFQRVLQQYDQDFTTINGENTYSTYHILVLCGHRPLSGLSSPF
ncbi:methyltransferase domain-containing protein [Pasteuria penetrans]|uniref:methyltransferase domain-containing protein n=1 Tax=Pasteuria penetrans TaxID=86005 RepID=UPI0011EF3284|nr:methyltransferase domain-containing protein [Pasteuria penetrans]